jgi:ABC-type dipeptide/oligopeptide/nickel transport system permease subunit
MNDSRMTFVALMLAALLGMIAGYQEGVTSTELLCVVAK